MRTIFTTVTARRGIVAVAAVLSIGVCAGLIVGGAFRGPRNSSDANAAQQPSATPLSTPATQPSNPLPSTAPLRQGAVVANEAAGDLTTEVALGKSQTLDGAVNAFTSYAVWLIGSPAAAEAPADAARAVGGRLVDPTDARLLADMQRSDSDAFEAAQGAYRILGHAGAAMTPDQVMIEVTAPLTLSRRTTWRTIGGVVGWTPTGWQLVSIRPHDVAQPRQPRTDVRSLSLEERTRTLPGLGWQAFRVPAGR